MVHLRVGDKTRLHYELDTLAAHISDAAQAHHDVSKLIFVAALNFSPVGKLYRMTPQAVAHGCSTVKRIALHFGRIGYNVSVRSSVNIDEDLCLMAGASPGTFIPSFGGLSQLMDCVSSGDALCPANRTVQKANSRAASPKANHKKWVKQANKKGW